ncbi:MAG TPA: AlpA family transcriptional regulator [Acidobacteriaceae bacterium]|jgi:prophage regulatory protein|nr:AlpA family transcriptional regulator [Acidobacteriaceae bacterium]
METPEKLLRVAEVCSRIGVSRPTVYRFVAAGRIPPPVKIGLRASGFPESEINAIIADRISASRMAAA